MVALISLAIVFGLIGYMIKLDHDETERKRARDHELKLKGISPHSGCHMWEITTEQPRKKTKESKKGA